VALKIVAGLKKVVVHATFGFHLQKTAIGHYFDCHVNDSVISYLPTQKRFNFQPPTQNKIYLGEFKFE